MSSINHLKSDHINLFALGLAEDVYGSNGDLDELEIKQRLIEQIHAHADYQYAASGMMPVWATADLIRSVWEYMDRKYMDQIGRISQIQEIVSPNND